MRVCLTDFSIAQQPSTRLARSFDAMSRFNEVASMFVRLDHVASGIINANHNVM